MNAGRRFLFTLAAVAVAGWSVGNAIWGPPGLSPEYLAEYKHDHDRYIEIEKNAAYDRYIQNPDDAAEATRAQFEAMAAFVEQYESREAYQHEAERMHTYELFFEFFNVGLVALLIVRFAVPPLLRLLDDKIADLRERIETAARQRAEADAKRAEWQSKLTALPDEEKRVSEATERQLEKEIAEVTAANQQTQAVLEAEGEDRAQSVWLSAKQQVRRELVDKALARIERHYREEPIDDEHAAFVDAFARDLERKS